MAAGLRHVWQRKELFMALLIAAMYNVTGFPFSTALMPIFAHDTLMGGVEALGLLNGAMGAGAVLGALVVAGLGNLRRQGWWLVWAVNGGWHGSMIIFAVAVMTLPGLLPYGAVLAIAMAIKVMTGIGRSVSLVLVMTVLMGNSDPEYRGRMGGMRVLAIQAHFPASALNGWMVTQIGAPMTALSLGIAGSVAVFLVLAFAAAAGGVTTPIASVSSPRGFSGGISPTGERPWRIASPACAQGNAGDADHDQGQLEVSG